ncbi:hemerythrin domain-containing protein [Meridianimarinicoccus sp. RP-17]|uniref:hemerythrin domain-containing protein n=1 Tax=Meridianimarinicoccus zhengii TaxID=2056810 RepID=UPI000DAB66FD|nr:hemerythrin domain-containing protein [Phycocomes zhengii]
MTDSTDDPLALGIRTGLPDALRVLADELPRAGWESHPGFAGLAQFWMERHLLFRRLMDALQTDAEARLDGGMSAQDHAARVQRLGGMLVGTLHEHHGVEDAVYFPQMQGMEPRLLRGFEMLDRDHHALDDWLARFTTAANTAIRQPDRDAVGAFHGELARFAPLLSRHLEDEEDLVVPVILRTGLR